MGLSSLMLTSVVTMVVVTVLVAVMLVAATVVEDLVVGHVVVGGDGALDVFVGAVVVGFAIVGGIVVFVVAGVAVRQVVVFDSPILIIVVGGTHPLVDDEASGGRLAHVPKHTLPYPKISETTTHPSGLLCEARQVNHTVLWRVLVDVCYSVTYRRHHGNHERRPEYKLAYVNRLFTEFRSQVYPTLPQDERVLLWLDFLRLMQYALHERCQRGSTTGGYPQRNARPRVLRSPLLSA